MHGDHGVRGALNDLIRWWVSAFVRAWGAALRAAFRFRLSRFLAHQRSLRARYGIEEETPVLRHSAEGSVQQGEVARTSGSSGVPKEIPYPARRVRLVKSMYMDAFCRAFAAFGVRRTSLYVFSATRSDDSLTSLMMREPRPLPPYLSTLQAPYRVHSNPDMLELEDRYGIDAVRLWVLALSNPGCTYATNPSTIALFAEGVVLNWAERSSLVRDWSNAPANFSRAVHRIANRIDSRGSQIRLARIARSNEALDLVDWWPGLRWVCCWDGGYVRVYLDRVRVHMPESRVNHLPMYSMSTETVETRPLFAEGAVFFVPVVPDVLVEFLPVDSDDDPTSLVPMEGLEEGEEYTMVVSDQWGLKRYQTEDVFSVFRRVNGLPDLRFERRRGLAFSFTGEKLTGDQAAEALRSVLERMPPLKASPWLVLVPSSEPHPHYKLVVTGTVDGGIPEGVEDALDEALGRVNSEYAAKRRSSRLGAPGAVSMPFKEALTRVGGQSADRSWQTQFKFLPLAVRTWEEMNSRNLDGGAGSSSTQ